MNRTRSTRWTPMWRRSALAAALVSPACSKAQPTQPPQAERDTTSPHDPKCQPLGSAERLELAAGETSAPTDGLLVTFESFQHDNFEDGTTDAFVELSFRSVSDDGAEDSALSWMPSIYDEPTFVHLAVNRCVRLLGADATKVTLELFRP